jgi:integrase
MDEGELKRRKSAGNVVIKKGILYARVRYKDAAGKTVEIYRRALSKGHARELAIQLKQEYNIGGAALLDGARFTFGDVAERYAAAHIQPPVYVGERKASGMRTWQDARRKLALLVAAFGSRPIRSITPGDIEQYKRDRLGAPTRQGDGRRTIASVNRELQLMRAVLYFAEREGWITKNPFRQKRALISPADERKRDRILTRDEEARLLAACVGRRAHLAPLVLFLLDTAARSGEALRLTWADVDFERHLVTLTSWKGKQTIKRIVGLTARAESALRPLRAVGAVSVFGLSSHFKRSFATACKAAGITNLVPHDLRHTAITRMIQAGLAPAEVMKLAGHTQIATFARYLNTDEETAQRAARALESFPSGSPRP